MSRPCHLPGILLILFALFAHLSGHAQIASADAQLSGFTYRLSDLAPDDGITPSITISPVNSSGRYVLSSSMAGSGFVHEFHVRGDPGTTEFVTEFGSASTGTGADFFNAAARFTTATSSYREFAGHNEYEFRFSMTPYTRIEFFADVSLRAADPGGAVTANARLTMSGNIDALGEPGFDSFGFARTVEDGSYAGQIYGELRSDADTAPSYFRMINDANVTANLVIPPPVPEPATVAMWLAGLVIGAGCAMRRCGRAQQLPGQILDCWQTS